MTFDLKRLALPASPKLVSLALGVVVFGAIITPFQAAAADSAARQASLIASPEPGWPQFRGPRRDGISDERGLLQTWPEGGPKLLWSVTGVGRGFSSPTFGDGRWYLTGDFGEDLYVLAHDLDGKPLWRAKNGASWLNQYQGARGSVTYSAGRVYHQNAHGRIACLDAAKGKEFWSVDLLQRFRGENITWGLSDCLIVDERLVYATAGGQDALLVALDKITGAVVWQSAPLRESNSSAETAGYAPPILVRFAGRRLLIGCTASHLFCADADTGKLQWLRARPTSYSVLAMSPVLSGDGVFMTAPFGPPGALHRLIAPASADATVGVEDAWTTKLDTAQGGVVHVNGRLFGSYYPRRGGWAALDAATGKVLYEAPELVKGAAIFADSRLYALCEDGWMLLLRDADTQFEGKGRFRFTTLRDRDAWAHPVILDGRLYLRYHDTLKCYDVRDATAAPGG
ncbi:MAG: PQQ-binding-like beta-propeller repeat protein [Opitutaceae bacterium]|nr:PQQ-binding-like beta-propeller repeat protein [Opitutaceae bacterium]